MNLNNEDKQNKAMDYLDKINELQYENELLRKKVEHYENMILRNKEGDNNLQSVDEEEISTEEDFHMANKESKRIKANQDEKEYEKLDNLDDEVEDLIEIEDNEDYFVEEEADNTEDITFDDFRPDLFQSIHNFLEFIRAYPHMWPSSNNKQDVLSFIEPFSRIPFMLSTDHIRSYLIKKHVINKNGIDLSEVDQLDKNTIDKDMWDVVHGHFEMSIHQRNILMKFNEDYLRKTFKSELDFIRMTWKARRNCYCKLIDWIHENKVYIQDNMITNIDEFIFLLMAVSSCIIKVDTNEIYNELKKRNIIIEDNDLRLDDFGEEEEGYTGFQKSLCFGILILMILTSSLLQFGIF